MLALALGWLAAQSYLRFGQSLRAVKETLSLRDVTWPAILAVVGPMIVALVVTAAANPRLRTELIRED